MFNRLAVIDGVSLLEGRHYCTWKGTATTHWVAGVVVGVVSSVVRRDTSPRPVPVADWGYKPQDSGQPEIELYGTFGAAPPGYYWCYGFGDVRRATDLRQGKSE